MIYLVLGSMAILMWKCGSQLLSEADYKVLKKKVNEILTNKGIGF